MKFIFVVNTLGLTGGIKVIFIHANYLANQGHDVSIVHLLKLEDSLKGILVGRIKSLKYLLTGLRGKKEPGWFSLDPRIKISHRYSLDKIGEFDALIATANETADWVANVPDHLGEKYYFVQDYESWTREQTSVDATYTLPLKKIVISSWLKNIMQEKFNQEVAGLVPNGIDFAKYNATEKKINRNKKILMQYHILEKKGIDIGLDALRIIKQRHPEVEIQLFGVYKPQHAFPNGTNYYFDPPQTQLVELYHTADIFILPSLQEGFSLPPMEAMAAKCAVIATNVGAVPDYSIPGETAIIIPPGDKEALVYELENLLNDDEKIQSLGKRANQHIQNFTWEKSSRELERILTS